MMSDSVQARYRIFVKGYRFLSFAKNMGKSIGKNLSKMLSGKYYQKFLDHAKQSATDALETTSKIVIQKTAEATGDLTGVSQRNNSENVMSEHGKKNTERKMYISRRNTEND